MAVFDFVSGEDFRTCLENDYQELNLAMQSKAWKAVHILAGSIVEALLVDYLVTTEYQKKTSSDPLKMTLAEAIPACRKENIISDRTEHLLHAIRSYRNLIHPGRSVRLGETPNENGAKIAQALVETIIEEIASRRKQNYGYTAEQLLTKLAQDASSVAIFNHLLKETNEYEIEHLLLRSIPEKYFYSINVVSVKRDILHDLVVSFRLSFTVASEETKKKVLKKFIKSIKEESSNVEWRYVFFNGEDLQYCSPEEVSLIKEHFLSIFKAPINIKFLSTITGISKYLSHSELVNLIYPYINSIAGYGHHYDEKETKELIESFQVEYYNMDITAQEAIADAFRGVYKRYNEQGNDNVVNAVKAICNDMISMNKPDVRLGDIFEDEHPF